MSRPYVYARSHGSGWRVMLEDRLPMSGQLGPMPSRPVQPATLSQRWEDDKPASFDSFDEADEFARSLAGKPEVLGVWQVFCNPEYVSYR